MVISQGSCGCLADNVDTYNLHWVNIGVQGSFMSERREKPKVVEEAEAFLQKSSRQEVWMVLAFIAGLAASFAAGSFFLIMSYEIPPVCIHLINKS